MRRSLRHKGFSLTEVLMAAGILAIGFMLILGTFPVGVHLTAKTAERTIGNVASDEAFAKIKLYGVDFSKLNSYSGNDDLLDTMYHKRFDFNRYNASGTEIDTSNTFDGADLDKTNISYEIDNANNLFSLEKFYPSDEQIGKNDIKYCWSAMCRRTDPEAKSVQVTVFVSRKLSEDSKYFMAKTNGELDTGSTLWPEPVKFELSGFAITTRKDLVKINSNADEIYFTRDCVILDDRTGRIYRVTDKYLDGSDWILQLDRDWEVKWYDDKGVWFDNDGKIMTDGTNHGSHENYSDPKYVWTVPPAKNSDTEAGETSPCVGVFQRIIRFDNE